MIIGLDTNIICYALDEDYPENKKLNDLLLNLSQENKIAINPTTIYEAYHVLVFGEKWEREEAAQAIRLLLKNPYIEFYNQTKKISTIALDLFRAIQTRRQGRTHNCQLHSKPDLNRLHPRQRAPKTSKRNLQKHQPKDKRPTTRITHRPLCCLSLNAVSSQSNTTEQ